MSTFLDALTMAAKRAADLLFVLNPVGTSLGAFSGVAIKGLIEIFSPTLDKLQGYVNLSNVDILYYVAMGIFAFNLPRMFREQRPLPKEVEDAFETIRRLKATKEISKLQIKLQYLALCADVVERARIPQKNDPSRRA